MKLGKKTFDESVQAAFEGTKKALGNKLVQAATDNTGRQAQHANLGDKQKLLQLRKRLGVSASQFEALQSSSATWAAHSAKQATTLYDRATEGSHAGTLLHHKGLERRAVKIAAERSKRGLPHDANAVRQQLSSEVAQLVAAQMWSAERKQVVTNLAADLIHFADRLPSQQAAVQKDRGNFVRRFGERSNAKATVLAELAGNVAARAGNKTSQAANSATRAVYDVATSGVAAVAVGAGVTVVGAALPLAIGTRLVWNAGAGVAAGAKGVGRALKQAANDGVQATKGRNAKDRAARNRFFGPRSDS